MITLLVEVNEAQAEQVRASLLEIDGVERVAVQGPRDEDSVGESAVADDDDDDEVDNPEFVAELRETLREGFAEIRAAHAEGRRAGRSLQELLDELSDEL